MILYAQVCSEQLQPLIDVLSTSEDAVDLPPEVGSGAYFHGRGVLPP